MTIGIIGCGRFGQLWASALTARGYTVLVFDINIERVKQVADARACSLAEVCKSDMLFLCVPISQIEAVALEIAPRLSQSTLVLDTCSVKEYPARVLRETLPAGQNIVCTHPLFGPDSASGGLAGHSIVMCPVRASEAAVGEADGLFRSLGLAVISATPQEHDRQMARSQALVHFIGRSLETLDLKDQELATPDYRSLLSMNTMVHNDTHRLFLDMQRYNPYARECRRSFRDGMRVAETAIDEESPLPQTLSELRAMIEETDFDIIRMMKKRMSIAGHIGVRKKELDLPVDDAAREQELRAFHRETAARAGLSADFAGEVFSCIMRESKARQI